MAKKKFTLEEQELIDEDDVLQKARDEVKRRIIDQSNIIDSLEKELRDAQNEICVKDNKIRNLEDRLKKVESSVTAEKLLEAERKKYGHAIGDKLFIIKTTSKPFSKKCPVCGGTHKLIINGIEITCSYCNGNGEHFEWVPDYEIREGTITANHCLFSKNDGGYHSLEHAKFAYSYEVEVDGAIKGTTRKEVYYDYITKDTPVFKTREEAEDYLKDKRKDYVFSQVDSNRKY